MIKDLKWRNWHSALPLVIIISNIIWMWRFYVNWKLTPTDENTSISWTWNEFEIQIHIWIFWTEKLFLCDWDKIPETFGQIDNWMRLQPHFHIKIVRGHTLLKVISPLSILLNGSNFTFKFSFFPQNCWVNNRRRLMPIYLTSHG